ncbi:MAG TPA: ComEC/Rec2 family competence protein [Pyrinomonadaceae bacterium]|nr:ComEC/Rec2 family competence protein [Pyrinomonadaceae bacterium]
MSSAQTNNSPADFTFYPLLWLAVCFALGILAANFLAFDWRFFLILCLIFGILTFVFRKQKTALIFLSIAFVAVGALYFQVEKQSISSNRLKKLYDESQIKSGDPIEIEGVIPGKPELAVGGFFLELKSEKAIYKGENFDVSGKIRLFAPVADEQIAEEYEQLDLRHGSRIRVACNLRREDNYLNPGVASRKEILDQKDIDATATIKSPLLVEKIRETNVFAPIAWIYEQRQNLIVDFRDNFSSSTAGVLIASLLGNRYFLDKQTSEIFREGGTFHVLVISGLHITFIGGLTLLFLRFFTRKRFWQFVFASGFLWAYSLAVGAEVPVVRATIMFTILLFSQVIYRRGTLLNALGACGLVLLVWRPEDLFSQSFHLTFVSVAAIVATAFPLIENLRAIGDWKPSAETPFPPRVPFWLKRFCEMLYWRERVWEIEAKRNIWSANLFKTPYLKWLEAKGLQGVLRYSFEALLVSAIVQIWLLPLLVVYFHRVSIASVLLNLWVGIFIALESFTAFFAVSFAQISENLALPFIYLTEIFNWFLLLLPRFFVENDWASFRLPVYSGAMKAVYILYFLPVLILTILLNRWKPFALISDSRFQIPDSEPQISNFKFQISNSKFVFSSSRFLSSASAVCLLLFFITIIFHPFSAPRADGRLHVDFLDVGQGDAALIRFPNGETLLVDGGGRVNYNKTFIRKDDEESELFEPDAASIGEAVVSEFLWETGYSQIDYILATHADADHIQGLTNVAKNFRVRTAIFGRTPLKDADFAALYEVLQKRNVEIVKLGRGDVLTFDEIKIEILYPEKDESPQAVSDNNNSLVLRVIFGEREFLLTGDIEKEAESDLVQTPEFLAADVVKVAHHGSRTSSTEEFVRATRAEYAVIPIGRESRFGHPHAEVVGRWKNSGAKILTTGERGTISISTNGKDLRVETFLP